MQTYLLETDRVCGCRCLLSALVLTVIFFTSDSWYTNITLIVPQLTRSMFFLIISSAQSDDTESVQDQFTIASDSRTLRPEYSIEFSMLSPFSFHSRSIFRYSRFQIPA